MTDNENEIKKRGKLSFRRKLGYAIGQFTDSTGFGLFGYFFLFFHRLCKYFKMKIHQNYRGGRVCMGGVFKLHS